MPFAGFVVSEGKMSLWSIVAAGVAGNVVGSWITYWIGLYGGRPFVDKYGKYVLMRHHHLDVAERWFDRWGAPTVFFSRMLPIVRTFISIPAGMAGCRSGSSRSTPRWAVSPGSSCSAIVGVKLGDHWEQHPHLPALPRLRRRRRAVVARRLVGRADPTAPQRRRRRIRRRGRRRGVKAATKR